MKFALTALLAIVFTGCSGNLYTHKKDFSPKKGQGPWNSYYEEVKDGKHPDDPNRRPLFQSKR